MSSFHSNISMHNLQAPNYPNPGRCWDIVDKYKVTIFYTAPTLVRSLMRDGDEARYIFGFACTSSNLIISMHVIVEKIL